VSISYESVLDAGELLVSAGLSVVADSTGITISAPAISTGSLTIDGETVATSKAVTFRIAGGSAGDLITITVDVDTDNSQHFDHDFVQEVI
jgi:hypothetical protein